MKVSGVLFMKTKVTDRTRKNLWNRMVILPPLVGND
jgi:hypothetical protein